MFSATKVLTPRERTRCGKATLKRGGKDNFIAKLEAHQEVKELNSVSCSVQGKFPLLTVTMKKDRRKRRATNSLQANRQGGKAQK